MPQYAPGEIVHSTELLCTGLTTQTPLVQGPDEVVQVVPEPLTVTIGPLGPESITGHGRARTWREPPHPPTI